MYVKTTKNKKGQAYYHLVESYRDKGKVRQRTLLSLGKVGEDRVEDLITAISRHTNETNIFEAIKSVSVENTFILGPLLVLQHIMNRFGISEILNDVLRKHPKLGFNFQRIVFTLIVCRFIAPSSKLKVFEHWQDELYPAMLAGKDELHHFYRALDLLASHKEDIESGLFWRERDLFSMSVDIVLYDLTTLRFESTREDIGELRRFGYSKEMRSDCTQVVLGLLADTEGVPLAFEAYPGNTFEGHTLVDIVTRMREKFRVRRFIFVADRGLFSAANLKHIRKRCGGPDGKAGEFIVGMKLGVFKNRHNEFYDRSRFTALSDQLEVYETTHGEDRCIITWSKVRAERDRKVRDEIIDKIEKKLKKPRISGETFVSNTNYKKYITGLKEGTPSLNKKAVEKEALRDGFFGVITNVPNDTMSAQEIVTAYKHLWIIEDAFGELKGTLRTRPIFHWTDERIIGHLTLCFLTYFCEAQMSKLLRQGDFEYESAAVQNGTIDSRALTVASVMHELKEVRAVPVKLQDKTAWVRTDIRGNSAKIFKALGLAIPPKLLQIEQAPEDSSVKCSGTN